MSLRDLATTALCAPTTTPGASSSASALGPPSAANPLAQLADAVLPTSTLRPEQAAAATATSTNTSSSTSALPHDHAAALASLTNGDPLMDDHQAEQQLQLNTSSVQLASDVLLFPSASASSSSQPQQQYLPVPASPPPVPMPVVGDPTDMFERAFKSPMSFQQQQSSSSKSNSSTLTSHPVSINHVSPNPTAAITTPTSMYNPHLLRHQPRHSWRDLSSSFSALSLQPQMHPYPSQIHVPPVVQTVQPVTTQTPQTSTATSSASQSVTTADGTSAVSTATTQTTTTATNMTEKKLSTDDLSSKTVSWSEEFASLEAMEGPIPRLSQQQEQQLLNEYDWQDDSGFEETLQTAFQHWLRRESPDSYQFTTSQTSNGRSVSEALQEGVRAHNEGRLYAAVYHLEDALQRNNNNASSTTTATQQETEGGLSTAKQALAWYVLGLSLADLDDDERAIQALSQCLTCYDGQQVGHRREDNPYLWQSLIALAVSYTNELEHTKALRVMREWINLRNSIENGDGEAGIPTLGGGTSGGNSTTQQSQQTTTHLDDFFNQSGHEGLLSMLNRTATENPSDADVFIVLGILHNLNRDYDAAAMALRHAVTLRPESPGVWNKLGATLANNGNSTDALRAYRKAVDLQPHLVRAWVNVGTAYSNRSEFSKAIRYYLKAIAVSKESARARTQAEQNNDKNRNDNFVVSEENGVGSDSAATESMLHVWGYLRSSLISLSRSDLLHLVESRDARTLRAHFNF